MIHLIENYYADPNNMGFTLVIDKGRKDKDGKKEERGGYYVTTEYYLLKGNWKRFADCKQSKTQIIEYLRGVKE